MTHPLTVEDRKLLHLLLGDAQPQLLEELFCQFEIPVSVTASPHPIRDMEFNFLRYGPSYGAKRTLTTSYYEAEAAAAYLFNTKTHLPEDSVAYHMLQKFKYRKDEVTVMIELPHGHNAATATEDATRIQAILGLNEPPVIDRLKNWQDLAYLCLPLNQFETLLTRWRGELRAIEQSSQPEVTVSTAEAEHESRVRFVDFGKDKGTSK